MNRHNTIHTRNNAVNFKLSKEKHGLFDFIDTTFDSKAYDYSQKLNVNLQSQLHALSPTHLDHYYPKYRCRYNYEASVKAMVLSSPMTSNWISLHIKYAWMGRLHIISLQNNSYCHPRVSNRLCAIN